METSEGVKTVLRQQAEAGVRTLLESLQTLKEGDLKELEQQVMATIFALGRGWMASLLSEGAGDERAPGERIGRCGHLQHLEGYRPKQVLTLMGKVSFTRAYYRCSMQEEPAGDQRDASKQDSCTHGEAPADVLLGLQGQRTSAGVRASGELSVCVLDAGRNRSNLQSAAPFADVGPPSPQPDATARRSPARA